MPLAKFQYYETISMLSDFAMQYELLYTAFSDVDYILLALTSELRSIMLCRLQKQGNVSIVNSFTFPMSYPAFVIQIIFFEKGCFAVQQRN